MGLKNSRIASPAAFRAVLSEGRHVRGALFSAAVRRVAGEEKKMGVSVARSVGGAVARNRWKRWVREAFRLNLPRMRPGFHLVVLIRKGSADADFHKTQSELLELLRRSGIVE